jgi:multidrug efflux pump subunit AcrA (membrane-fusion protein)
MKSISINLLKWPATLGICAALLVLAFFVHAAVRSEHGKEESDKVQREKDEDRKPGEVKVDSDKDDYQVVPAGQVKNWSEPLTVYGRIVPNPRAVFEVRTLFPGTLRKDKAGWLFPGQQVRAGQTLAWVDIRVEPQVRVDAQAKLAEAQHQEEGAAKTRTILEKRVKRFEGASQSLPPRELEDALIQLRETRTKHETAQAAVKLWSEALAEMDRSKRKNDSHWTRPLTAPSTGEITELLAQPGTALEAGGVVARLVDFRRLVVRLDFPPEALAGGPPPKVDVTSGSLPPPALRGARNQPRASRGARPVPASLLHQAPQVDAASQYTGYFYEMDADRTHIPWRPGLFVRAELTGRRRTDAVPRPAIMVPATALLYHQGRALIYLRKEEGAHVYARREVEVLGRDGEHWILAANPNKEIVAGKLVVARNAQELLAAEFITDEDD